jgi:hypothetical protein
MGTHGSDLYADLAFERKEFFRKERTIMKKFYVQPVATNVAFVVNENIAFSFKIDESWIGEGTYDNVAPNNCNEVFNSTEIKTYLKPGETDIQLALANVAKYSPDDLNDIIAKLTSGQFNCY